MIDFSRLNAHSREFAQLLFEEFPEWLPYGRFDPYEDFEKEALLVEVPRPGGNSVNGLFITTSEWEIAVGFGENFHTRFGASDDPKDTDFYHTALDFIKDFIAEKVVLATAWKNTEWMGAWKIYPENEALDDREPDEGVVIKLRSWHGTYDREI